MCRLGGQFSKNQPKNHNVNLFSLWTPINGSIVTPFKAKNDATPFKAKNDATETKRKLYGIFKILDNLFSINYCVINLYYTRLNDWQKYNYLV